MEIKLAENIRALRKQLSLTQEQLAEAMEISTGAVSKWEQGNSVPELDMLIALADFFSVSVDALLGYEIRNKDREETVEQLKNDLKNNNFTDGSRRWEKAVKKYPNCFDVIYNSGNLYYIGGVDTKNKAWFGRAIELFLRAIDLIGQNSDPKISELFIRIQIASVYLCMGETKTALTWMKKYNFCGMNNGMIGNTLAAVMEQYDEALPYLSEALIDHICGLVSVVNGYINVFMSKGEYENIFDMAHWMLNFNEGLKIPGRTNFFDKIKPIYHALCSVACSKTGQPALAQQYLEKAWTAANAFDADPDYSTSSLRYYYGEEGYAHDDIGGTASGAVSKLFEENDGFEDLKAVWEAMCHEKEK